MSDVEKAGFWRESMEGDVLVAAFKNSPMNYFTQKAVNELEGLIDRWRDTPARAIVITGDIPGKFITHFDVEEILPGVLDSSDLVKRGPLRNQQIDRMLTTLTELPQPVIAALNGDAMGFGFELALACDIRVMEVGDYRIGPCEVALGIIPGAGGTQRLVRLVGLGRALDMVLQAKVFTPDEAKQEGLVTAVAVSALTAAMRLARRLSDLPAQGIAMAKRSIHLGSELPLSYALQVESDASLRTKLSPDTAQALRRYLDIPPAGRRDVFDAWRSILAD
jgi:enoyl-CoA hydratase